MSVSTFVGFEFPSFESAHPEMLGRWGRVERWDRVVGDCVVHEDFMKVSSLFRM